MSTQSTAALWQIRKAVKPWLEDTSQPILFGCSGGADSLAMALALFAEANGQKVIPVVVDHGLQPESEQVTQQTIKVL
ncbi:MAG TPA: tRNA(Ile)-lysidine synthetase, partial [Actinobacteria bacterium]|nr:tRNA(Ile)-lysidine synthetase [Actinomycetota bacterium]